MSYDNPNFTIITSGGCNSFCDFCTDAFKRKASEDYIPNLISVLADKLPSHFKQCSISGGEPTLSPDLASILTLVHLSKRFEKVVLTTNGARLARYTETIAKYVNHVNVSRHAIGYQANTKVFGTPHIITDEELKDVAFELNKAGVDVNLNHVYTKDSQLDMDYVLRYLDYARSVGATSVSFRYDQNENSLEPTYLERLFSEWKTIREGSCPVCRNHTVLVGGFPVVFKAAYAEPSKAIADVYELVYHITGKLTTDWEGRDEFTAERQAQYGRAFSQDPFRAHEVVAHAVKAPSNPARGQKAAPRAVVEIKPAVAEVVGGGCGQGGGCGRGSAVAATPVKTTSNSSAVATKPRAKAATTDFGGGCGGFGFGGGCGR